MRTGVENAAKIEPAASPSAEIHAVNAMVTEGLNRDRIEPPQHFARGTAWARHQRNKPIDLSSSLGHNPRRFWPCVSLSTIPSDKPPRTATMSKTNLQILLLVGLVGSFLGTYYSVFIALLGVLFYPNVFYIIRMSSI